MVVTEYSGMEYLEVVLMEHQDHCIVFFGDTFLFFVAINYYGVPVSS